MPQEISGLRELYDQYDLFLLDQLGVLHDSRHPYPHAVAALKDLRSAGKRSVIISNSGKRRVYNAARMEGIGFENALYDDLVTSGEVAWNILRREMSAAGTGSAIKCLFITGDDDRSPVDGLNVQLVDAAAEADVVLISSTGGDRFPQDHYRHLLRDAASKGVPCVCTNPDKIALVRGTRTFGAGRIAEIYEELGGEVRWLGKPFPEIYQFACALAGNVDPARVVCVGDSVEHDIAGARDAGFDSVLVRDGIATDLGAAEIAALERQHNAFANFTMDTFAP